MSRQLTITYVEEKILSLLDEAWDDYCYGGGSEFVNGIIYACVIILEDMFALEGMSDEALLDFERQYGIR